ncbi:Ig-like domain-containing protein, partial [Vibrio ouci]
MGLLKYLAIGNVAGGQTLVIDVNGDVRILLDGEQPSPGEVVLNSDGTSGAGSSDVQVGLVDLSGAAQDITLEVEDIFAALEGGQDPTQLGDDFATAAGGEGGSSLTGTGTIERDGSETLAETNFDTDGFESLGLSETQSITLIELEQQSAPFFSDDNGAPLGESVTVSTDEDTDVAGLLAAIDPDGDTLTFALTPDGAPANGTVTLNPDGSWNYTPNTNFDGTDSFTATVSDGLGGVDTLVVNIIVNPIPEISVSGGGLVNEGSDAVFVVDFDKASNQTTSLNLSTNLLTVESDDIGEIQVVTNLDQVLTVNLDGSVDVPPGVTSLTVTVPTVQDDVFEGDESFELIVQPLSGLLGGGSSDAIIKDDGNGPGEDPDDDTPTLNVSDAQQVQEGTDAEFDVSLSNLVDADVTYDLAINLEGQTAELADFQSPTFSVSYQFEGELFELDLIGSELTIPGTATDLVVSVSTVNDDIFEGVESFELLVDASFSVEGSTIELDGSGAGSIVDDGDEVNNDLPALTVTDAGQVVEGSTAEFGVSLDKEVDGTLNYVFTLDVDEPLTAEMADFLANGNLTVSYTDSNGPQSFPISNGGNLD